MSGNYSTRFSRVLKSIQDCRNFKTDHICRFNSHFLLPRFPFYVYFKGELLRQILRKRWSDLQISWWNYQFVVFQISRPSRYAELSLVHIAET